MAVERIDRRVERGEVDPPASQLDHHPEGPLADRGPDHLERRVVRIGELLERFLQADLDDLRADEPPDRGGLEFSERRVPCERPRRHWLGDRPTEHGDELVVGRHEVPGPDRRGEHVGRLDVHRQRGDDVGG